VYNKFYIKGLSKGLW